MRIYLILTVLLIGVSGLQADSVVLNPIADAPIFELYGSNNYGTQTYGYWGYYNGGQRTLLLYDLTGVSGTVMSAQLSWEFYNNYGTGADMWACAVTGGTWDEYTVTWDTQPAHDESESGRLLDIPWDTSSGVVVHDCTAQAVGIIQGWVDDPASNYGILLRKNPEPGNEPRCYPYMKESSNQPVLLIVEYDTSALESMTFGQIKALFSVDI